MSLARFKFAIPTLAFAAALLCVSSIAQPAMRGTAIEQPATTAIPNGKYYALVIGINAYPAPLHSLKTAENDAQAIAKTLNDDYAFDVKILLGADAKRNNILAAINQYETTLQPNDNLLIYYAGHGYENKNTGKAYWLPADADSTSNPNRIIADDITSEMAAIPARHVLLISDSCYSGGLTRDTDVIPQSHGQEAFLQKMLNGHSRTLMASGGDEPVSDSGKDGHSAFAYAVLQALVNTHQALFTASDLFYDGTGGVQRRVSGNTEQVPQYAVIRNSGHDEGDFVFTRKNATGAEIAAKLAALGPAFNRGAALFDSKHYFAALPLLASACEAKSYRACSYLGLMYEDGHGVPTNIVRAIALFMQACDNGDGKGCNDLAILYDHGTGLPKDISKAAEFWAKACNGNYALSCSSLGAMYAFSDQPHDYARAAELFNKNCDEVSQLGCRGLGVINEKGLGRPPDEVQAQLLYRKGCDFGDGQSCIKVGIHAMTKSPPDYQVGTYAYRRACDLAVASGCELLGFMQLQGQGIVKDDLEAAALYGQACDSDPNSGCESLGLAYENGWGVTVDYAQAAYIFTAGCDAADPNSCRELGSLYEDGVGVKLDYAQALTLYRKGCDAEDANSCSNLGALYEKGTGVPQDIAKAIPFYRSSCDAGSAKGCINLGHLYENGTGVTQDKAQAITLYRKACDTPNAEGCTNLKRLQP